LEILNLYISTGHNYVGHHGKPAGTNVITEVDRIECVAGRGVKGDRYFDHKENFLGQITFFADEVYQQLKKDLGIEARSTSVFRRNVIVSGVDLNEFIDREFEVQGVRFRGTEECRPCYWMNEAFGPGAEEALRTRGGLRAQILTDGVLEIDGSR
jgi:MOSC domain-containing protein YiiM